METLREINLCTNHLFTLIKYIFLFSFPILTLTVFYSLSPFPTGLSCSSPASINASSLPSRELLEPTQLTHLIFGIGGSARIWQTRQEYPQLWWDTNTTRGFVWLDKEPSKPTTGGFPPYRISNWTGFELNPTQKPSDADRMARIVKENFELGLPNIRWFVMGDDDTVFFPENLVKVLSKYDHREMYYIGAPSESVEQAVKHGYDVAFGGGGFAVSYGLACELVRILDGCIKRYHYLYGSDEKVSACVAELGVPLTREPGFHQFDIRGDPYGFLVAHPVAPLVSLHHLVFAPPLFPGYTQVDSLKRLMQAYRVDPALTVQQSFCYDHTRNWSVSVSWGYSAQLYPLLAPTKFLNKPLQTFRTWMSNKDGPFTFNTRPMTDNPCQRPIVFYLDQVKEVGEGKTVSTYKRAAASDRKQCRESPYMDATPLVQMTVSASKTDPEKWIKAPRRECCEIINSQSAKTDLQIMIRRCKPKEYIIM